MTTGVKIISAGVRKVDGGSMFGTVPKAEWVGSVSADRKNRITLGLNCVLLKTAGKTVLVDTGAGSSGNEGLGLAPSRLSKNLRSIGVAEKSIDIVILSNLHFDHCGGSIRLDRAGNIVPTFPHASYFVQSTCWQAACHPLEHCFAAADAGNFRPLVERGQWELIDGIRKLFPGCRSLFREGMPKDIRSFGSITAASELPSWAIWCQRPTT
jgi:glyoxylase-like metal-dependent hydrolase (beta-lactamase superfamily II)